VTPVDIAFWIMVLLIILSIAMLILGIAADEIGAGVGLMLVFLGMAFLMFILWALLWVIYKAVT
jgi:hypothetical protein